MITIYGERLFREIDADGVEHYFMLTTAVRRHDVF
jgi:hypothetical protein